MKLHLYVLLGHPGAFNLNNVKMPWRATFNIDENKTKMCLPTRVAELTLYATAPIWEGWIQVSTSSGILKPVTLYLATNKCTITTPLEKKKNKLNSATPTSLKSGRCWKHWLLWDPQYVRTLKDSWLVHTSLLNDFTWSPKFELKNHCSLLFCRYPGRNASKLLCWAPDSRSAYAAPLEGNGSVCTTAKEDTFPTVWACRLQLSVSFPQVFCFWELLHGLRN